MRRQCLIKIDASNEGKDSTWLDTSSGWRDDTNEPVIELATSRNQGHTSPGVDGAPRYLHDDVSIRDTRPATPALSAAKASRTLLLSPRRVVC